MNTMSPDDAQVIRIFQALAAPFHPSEIKTRSQGGKQMPYVTARVVMNRLDEVILPHNWWDEYDPRENSVICRLTLRLPSGQLLTKIDAGAYAGMPDSGDDDKSGYSDAFKRAAVKFGCGRFLYNDGIPIYSSEHTNGEVPNQPQLSKPIIPDNKSGHGKGIYASAEQVIAFNKWIDSFCLKANGRWHEVWEERYAAGRPIPSDLKDYLHVLQARNHLMKWCIESERLDPAIVPEDVKPAQKDKFIAIVYHRSEGDKAAIRAEMVRYAGEQKSVKEDAIFRKSPEMAPDGYFEEQAEYLAKAEDESKDVPDVQPETPKKRMTKAELSSLVEARAKAKKGEADPSDGGMSERE